MSFQLNEKAATSNGKFYGKIFLNEFKGNLEERVHCAVTDPFYCHN